MKKNDKRRAELKEALYGFAQKYRNDEYVHMMTYLFSYVSVYDPELPVGEAWKIATEVSKETFGF